MNPLEGAHIAPHRLINAGVPRLMLLRCPRSAGKICCFLKLEASQGSVMGQAVGYAEGFAPESCVLSGEGHVKTLLVHS